MPRTGGSGGQPLRRGQPFMQAGLVAGLRDFVKASPAEWSRLLESSDLASDQLLDPDAPLPLASGFRAFEAAADLRAMPTMGIQYAHFNNVGTTGVLGYAVASARTVREAMQTVARFMPLVASLEFSRYTEDGVSGTISWRYPVSPAITCTQFAMWGTTAVILRLQRALGPAWRSLSVEFDRPRPQAEAPYEDTFGYGLSFNAPVNRFSVTKRDLDVLSPAADGRLFKLMNKLATIEKQNLGIAESQFETEVRAHLLGLLQDGKSKLADLADALSIEPARLRAELSRHRVTFKDLLNSVRKEAAKSQLLETELSITEIAFSLGYSDPSLFTRACHKWFESSPRDMRSQARA